jgi:RNA polymerase sigma-70 factor (ECF subfamily)
MNQDTWEDVVAVVAGLTYMNDMNDLVEKTSEFETRFGRNERDFVYAVARRIVPSTEDAEDVTQDAMLLAYRHRARYRGDARYRTWLYRIASTTALGYLRRRRRSRELLAPTEAALEVQVADDRQTPDAALAEAETRGRVREAVATLAPKYRDVLLARTTSSDTETASRLGISVANVKIRAHRARKLLRPVLAGVQ